MVKKDEKQIDEEVELESPAAPPPKKTYKTKNNSIAERLATHIKIEDLSKIKFTTKQAKILLGEEDKKPPSRFKSEEAKQLSIKRMREGLKKYHSDLKLAKEEIAREKGQEPKLVLQVNTRKNIKKEKKVSIKSARVKGDVSDDEEEPVSEDEDRRKVKPSSDDDTDHIIHKVNKKVSKKNSKLAEINAKIAAQQEAMKPVNPYAAQLKSLWG